MMAEDELKGAKKTRRNAKSTFTRCGNWLTNIVEVKRPESEVRDALSKVEEAYNDLVVKHENYTTLMRRSNRNFNIPPRANPGHLTIFCARGVGNLTDKAFPGVGNLTLPGWGGEN